MLGEIRAKAEAGKRLDRSEGLWLLTEAPLLDLGALAEEARYRLHPEKQVSFVIDSNPNYTNVCVTDCQFCAFYRKPGDAQAWTLTVEEVLQKVESAAKQGATTVLLQGGHNPALPLEYYLSLVSETRRRFPQVTPHFFTASEIMTMAEVSGLAMPDVLARLLAAGQKTLPGGGAEVLSERVRKRIEPKKGGPRAWLDVHREAHRVGLLGQARGDLRAGGAAGGEGVRAVPGAQAACAGARGQRCVQVLRRRIARLPPLLRRTLATLLVVSALLAHRRV